MSPRLPVGAVVAKRCSCGQACRDERHPRYTVEAFTPNMFYPDIGVYRLRRHDTGRAHTTRTVGHYVIVSLPDESVLVSP